MNLKRRQLEMMFQNWPLASNKGLWFSGEEYEGELKLWWTNGILRMHYFYKDGREHGEYKEWNRSGKLREHDVYHEGELVKDYLNDT